MNIFIDILLSLHKINPDKNFLFVTNFTDLSLKISTVNSYNFTNYTYFVVKNFLLSKNINHNERSNMLELFNKTQNIYLRFLKLKKHILFKKTIKCGEKIDLQFNNLSSLNKKYIITLIDNHVKYHFSIFDLIKIINSSLSFETDFFPEPQHIKNPWNNNVLSKCNLYNIYFFIKNTETVNVPILFDRFFQSNFCFKHFLNNNQLIIKNYIIKNCHNMCDEDKIHYIHAMLRLYNVNTSINSGINVDKHYPNKNLLHIFSDYIQIYLMAKYSYEADIRIKNRIKLNRKLRLFEKTQPRFGNRYYCRDIIKLYFISKLKYDTNTMVFFGEYIPKPDMIFLRDKSFIIDYIEENSSSYSIFTQYNSNHSRPNINININVNIYSMLKCIREFKFTKCHLDSINVNKYYEDVTRHINTSYTRLNYDENHDLETEIVYPEYNLVDNNFTEFIDTISNNDSILDVNDNNINNDDDNYDNNLNNNNYDSNDDSYSTDERLIEEESNIFFNIINENENEDDEHGYQDNHDSDVD